VVDSSILSGSTTHIMSKRPLFAAWFGESELVLGASLDRPDRPFRLEL